MGTKLKEHRHVHSENCFKVTVRLLEDDANREVNVPEDATGKWLFDEVCRQQGVMEEREYFGLRYLVHELLSPPTKQWIDLTRSVLVQLKNTHPRTVSFRIKHYPADPFADVKLAKTHYLLYRQIRRDLASGRLVAGIEEMVRLAALIVQVELGDSSMQDLPQISTKTDSEQSYLSEFQVLHNQTRRMETMVLEEHKKLEGLLPSEAANEVIQLASSLETYGVDPIRVKTKSYGSRPIHLGLTHRGVTEFVSNRCQKIYLWSNIAWMTCDCKCFILAHSKQLCGKRKKTVEMVSYKCETKAVARALWEWATDRQLFLTLEKSSSVKPVKSKRGLFSRRHTFNFSGRCRREVLARPTLAATLPSDIGNGHSYHVDSFAMSKMPSAGSHSNSMVALPQEVDPIGHTMQAIIELDIGEGTEPPNKDKPDSATLPNNISGMNERHTRELPTLPRLVPPDLLAPLFEELPRRRYTPDAKTRQKQLVRTQRRNRSGDKRHADIFDSDEDLGEAEAIAELDAVTEAASLNLTSTPQTGLRSSNSGSFFSRFLSNPFATQSNSNLPDSQARSRTSSSVYHSAASMTSPESAESDDNQSPTGWSLIAASAGIISGLSLVGLALVLETEVHSPIMVAFRQHPWILEFDTRYYRPFRTALFGFWRR